MTEGEKPVLITAALVRDAVVCERRAWHDLHTDRARAEPVTPFADRLWRMAPADPEGIVAALDGSVADLRLLPDAERLEATAAALAGGADHVLGARIVHGGLVGAPELLSRIDGRWLAGAIRFGRLHDGAGVPNWPLAVEVGFEARVLATAGHADGTHAFVIAPDHVARSFDLTVETAPDLPSIAGVVDFRVRRARDIARGAALARGEAHPRCGLCRWRGVCAGELEDDLTRVHGIDRWTRRDVERLAPNLIRLARLQKSPGRVSAMSGTGFQRLRDRARLLVEAGSGPLLRQPLPTPLGERRAYLHVETDPTRETVFAHGVLAVDPATGEAGDCFVADGPEEERHAFAAAVSRLSEEVARGAAVLISSNGVRDALFGLDRRHPDVCPPGMLERLLDGAVDIQGDLVEPCSDWPVESYDVASIAGHLGFRAAVGGWSDDGPVARFDAWQRTGSEEDRDAVGEAMRAACEASRIVVEALERMAVEGGGEPVVLAHAELSVPPAPVPAMPRAVRGAATTLYSHPTLRPCRGIAPEPDDGGALKVGLHDTYGALAEELPLLGADAMRTGADGGIGLCERLRAALPWMASAVDLIERQLRVAVWAGRPWLQFRPICLAGPPDVGKSHLARELGRIAGIGGAALDLGAMHDAATLVAVSRGWTNTKPCWPAQMMVAHRCANPVLTLDELEKSGGSRRNGDPLTALLGMLEPSTARTYFDTCLMCEVDLSQVCWICTANDAAALPAPLASRLDVVEVGRPAPEHFDVIMGGLLVGMAGRWGVPPASMPQLPGRAEAVLRDAFARKRSIRLLRRQVEDVVAALVAGPRRDTH